MRNIWIRQPIFFSFDAFINFGRGACREGKGQNKSIFHIIYLVLNKCYLRRIVFCCLFLITSAESRYVFFQLCTNNIKIKKILFFKLNIFFVLIWNIRNWEWIFDWPFESTEMFILKKLYFFCKKFTFFCVYCTRNLLALVYLFIFVYELSQKNRLQSVPIAALCLYYIQRENLGFKKYLCIWGLDVLSLFLGTKFGPSLLHMDKMSR